jgi:CubicO group peptidase (beta-lactamase class C family)
MGSSPRHSRAALDQPKTYVKTLARLTQVLGRRPNDAYNHLAAVIEVAAGQPFETYVRERVLSPAGMHATGFWGEPRTSASFAPVAKRLAPIPNWGYKGATGISSTAGDLHRWHLALAGNAVLPDSTRRQLVMEQVQKPNGGAYGYGWQVARTRRGTTLLAHSGAESELRHFASVYRFVDEGVVVIALSNAREEIAQETFSGLLRVLFPLRSGTADGAIRGMHGSTFAS